MEPCQKISECRPTPSPPEANPDLLTLCAFTCLRMCFVFTAHPDSPEAALCAGGGPGGVSFGSQTVHGVCLRPDWMSTVSLYSLCSLCLRDLLYDIFSLSSFLQRVLQRGE